jgi:tetratricopeptide (TPR) repeat protein
MSSGPGTLSVDQALMLAAQGQFESEQRYEEILSVLESHECWVAWFAAIKQRHSMSHDLTDFIRMIRVNIFYLEDVEAASRVAKELVGSKKMSYSEFRRLVIDKVVETEDYKTEGALLKGVWDVFLAREDQIAVVERLCFIFEKKAHNETQLQNFYGLLRRMHPENAKALRYFRNLYSQSQDWGSAIDVLKKLLSSAKHKQEVFRYAQELAAVYLYQLGDCREAIRYIEEYCAGSTLDTSTVHYEAYYRLGNLEGCLRVLRSALLVVEDADTRAIIHYRIASIYDQLGQYQLAHENFRKTLELNDDFFEAIEGLISSSIKLKDWPAVRQWLDVLAEKTRSPNLAGQLKAGIQRLDEGMAHANATR